MYSHDSRVVLSLDAGGTNCVFTAIQGQKEIVPAFRLPTHADNLERCLSTLLEGFCHVRREVEAMGLSPVAVSFAFPGPADYAKGIIMDLNNLPAFRGGVPLKDFLEDNLHLPVFINNDADLFAYGESIAGALPYVNRRLEEAGCHKRFRNLIGFTFGTGFGCGIVHDGRPYLGDNSSAAEICQLRHRLHPEVICEDGVSIRAIKRVYHEHCDDPRDLTPRQICEIADGTLDGDKAAAIASFEAFGRVAGDGIAQANTLLDGLLVLGGGLCGSRAHFIPSLMKELNGRIDTLYGYTKPRCFQKVFYLDDPQEFEAFCQSRTLTVEVPGSHRRVEFDPVKRTGLLLARLDTSQATCIGAYAFALASLDEAR